MFRILIWSTLLLTSPNLLAKEINLSCSYVNVNGGTNVDGVYLNTATAQASYEVAGQTIAAKLFSDAKTYWFTVEDSVSRTKVRINRNTLGFDSTLQLKGMDIRNDFSGSCEIVESKSKI